MRTVQNQWCDKLNDDHFSSRLISRINTVQQCSDTVASIAEKSILDDKSIFRASSNVPSQGHSPICISIVY
jgi:hypothetical protein